MAEDPLHSNETFRVADSPWFWGLIFSTMSLVGMGVIGPKFDRRQGQIEGRFAGREQAHLERQRRSAGLPPVDLAAEARDANPAKSRIVPLWTLASLASAAGIVSAAMLAREWTSRRSSG